MHSACFVKECEFLTVRLGLRQPGSREQPFLPVSMWGEVLHTHQDFSLWGAVLKENVLKCCCLPSFTKDVCYGFCFLLKIGCAYMKNTWFLLLAKALFVFDRLLKTLFVVFLIVIYRDPLRDQDKNLKKKINIKFNTFIKCLKPQLAKNLSAVQETRVQFLGREDPLEKEMATHSSILAWRTPRSEDPGGQQSMGLQESDST